MPLTWTTALAVALAGTLTLSQGSQAPARFSSDRIVVVTRGTGTDLILIPGLAAHPDVWTPVIDRVGARFRVHTVHVKGFAGLPPDANTNGAVVGPLAEEIARYARETRLANPIVVGHSLGGTLTMMLGARHADVVGRLLVVDTPPFMGVAFGGATPEEARPAADRIQAAILSSEPGAPGDVLEPMVAGMTRTDAARPSLLQHARESHRATVARAFHDLIVTDLRPELTRIKAPMTVLFAVPRDMPMSADAFEDLLREAFAGAPQARLVRVDDTGHFIQIDQPDRVVAELLRLTQ